MASLLRLVIVIHRKELGRHIGKRASPIEQTPHVWVGTKEEVRKNSELVGVSPICLKNPIQASVYICTTWFSCFDELSYRLSQPASIIYTLMVNT